MRFVALRRRTVLLVGACGVAVGLAIALFPVNQRTGVSLEPAVVPVPADLQEGQDVTASVVFKNNRSDDVTIVGAYATCGCAQLRTRGQRFTAPIRVAPGESIPWETTIDTAGRFGDLSVAIVVTAEVQGKTLPLVSTVPMNVRVSWRADPPQLVFHDLRPGKEASAKVVVGDTLFDPGVRLREAVSSDPSILRVAVQELTPQHSETLQQARPSGGLKPRYEITASLLPQGEAESGRAWITVSPVEEARPTLCIPVHYTLAPPPYRARPSLLLVGRRTEESSVTRKVYCDVAPDANANLRLLHAPSYARVDIRELDAVTKAIEVVLSPEHDARDAELTFAAGESDDVVLAIPIRFYSSP